VAIGDADWVQLTKSATVSVSGGERAVDVHYEPDSNIPIIKGGKLQPYTIVAQYAGSLSIDLYDQLQAAHDIQLRYVWRRRREHWKGALRNFRAYGGPIVLEVQGDRQ